MTTNFNCDYYLSLLKPNELTIFLLHGVVNKSNYRVRNYTRKHILVDEFARLARGLVKVGTPLSMDEAVKHISNKLPFPKNAFAITFDDGFENNLTVAVPVLKELGIPATIYVTTKFVDENGMSWIDRIEYCFENMPSGSIRLPWEDETRKFNAPEAQIDILREIRRQVKSSPSIKMDSVVSHIYEELGLDEITTSDDPLDKKLNWAQVRSIASDPNLTIGGHSHTHPVMAFLSDQELENEIAVSLNLIREKAGVISNHYCYPEGMAHCFDARVIRRLKAHGIVCSPTAIEGSNDLNSDLFTLKRYFVV